jgi:Ankyrin repeats (3 copies)
MKKILLLFAISFNGAIMPMEQKITSKQRALNQKLFTDIAQNHIEEVKEDIKKGADVNSKSSGENRESALSKAIMHGNLEIAQILLNKGAKPNDTLALLQAISNNDLKAVKMLLEAGASVQPVHKKFALDDDQADMINLLKEPRGANALQIVNKEHYNKKVIPPDLYKEIGSYNKEIGSHNLEDID